MRKILLQIGILVLVLGMMTAAHAAKTDAPHQGTNAVVCNDCHAYGSYPLDDACISCHTNATGGGYSHSSAPAMITHSSANTSTKYGTWSFYCKNCHQQHTQNQREVYGSASYLVTGTITSVTIDSVNNTVTYGYNNMTALKPEWADYTKWTHKSMNASSGNERGLIMFPAVTRDVAVSSEIIEATATTVKVKGNPGTVNVGDSFAIIYGQQILASAGGNVVKLFNNTGQNSFAYDESSTGTDPTPDGICQVCHTKTEVFRSNGTGAATGTHAGRNGVNCISCHRHEEGFKASCDSCHGQPPVDAGTMVSAPAPTGSATPGAHNKHVNVLGLGCAACHNNSVGSGSTHNDGTVQAITMGFYLFGGTVQGGSYDGQAGVDYNTTPTTPPTTVSNNGTMQCSNIYCHSTGQSSSGGALAPADYKTPSWGDAVVCGDCHNADGSQGNATTMNTGSHTAHLSSPVSKTCSDCHRSAGEGTASHANNNIEVSFNVDPFGNPTSYSQSPNTPGNGYGSCSNVYCHSIGQENGGGTLVTGTADYKTPTWGGTVACGDCHALNMTSGSHTVHLADGYVCANCHNNAGSGTSKHADRNVDIEFNAQSGATGAYSQNPNPAGNGYGSCSTTYCHGASSPQWGTTSGAAQCEKCHGSAATAALGSFKDTSGNTAGNSSLVHVAHLAGTHNLANGIACSSCHAVPGTVNAAGHNDSALPAEVNASRGYAAGTCSTTSCHGIGLNNAPGNNSTPAWTDTAYLTGDPAHDCAQCHGYPPAGTHPAATATQCINCHDHVNSTGTGFTDLVPGPSKHVNGVVNISGGDLCLDCHSSLSATHAKHVDAATVLAGKSYSAGDYGQAWFYGVTYVSGSPKFGCGYCHPNTSGTHMNGVKNLNFDPFDAAAAGTVKAKNGYESYNQTSGTSVTCSSVYCHSNGYNDGTGYIYQTTPDWYGGSFTGDKCANCHGNSPNSGGKIGSVSHYNPDSMGLGVVGGHFVGIHYKNVFTGTTGLTKDASNRQNAHGDTLALSTTINCSTCHNATVTATGNDLNTVCSSCHSTSSKGTMVIATTGNTHINGQPDVVFDSSVINSRAQLRDDITKVNELNTSWTRTNGYKAANSYDGAKTTATWDGGAKTCSAVACHNGNTAQWGATNITCNSCHKSLP